MPNPRKKAASNIARRKAEKEETPLYASSVAQSRDVRYKADTGDIEQSRTVHESDLTPGARNRFKKWRESHSGRKGFQTYPPSHGKRTTTVESFLYDEIKRMGVKRNPWSIISGRGKSQFGKLIQLGLVDPRLEPKESARQRAARKVATKKRNIHEARQRPLEEVAMEEMTAKEREAWAKRKK